MASSSRRQQGSRHAHTPALFARSPYARSLRCEALEDRRMLALLTVTTDQDVVDLNDGQTSLREAIFAANLVPGADEIQFDFGHDGPATILLTEGELRIEDSLTITGPGAGLLTIDASGNDPTPDVNNGDGSRVINVTNQSALFLKGLTITGGDTTGDGAGIRAANLDLYQVHVNDNFTLGGGGGLSIVGQLVANHSVISGNTAQGLSGVGGIRLYGDAKIENCTISNNVTIDSFYGVAGGMLVYGSVEIKNSTISDNSTDIGSGGIRVHRGALTVTDSLITGNTGGSIGGGIGIRDGELVLTNTTIIENTNDDGGGVSIEFSYASIVNSTISHNSALDEGGGIYVRNSIFKIDHTTITHNHANTDEDTSGTGGGIYARGAENRLSKINNSIVAHNTRNGEATDVVTLVSKPTISHSLIGSNFGSDFPEAPIGSPDANGNLIGGPIHGAIDPLLGPLADNGGPTLTHALLPGSPAINAGDPTLVAGVGDTSEFDQRGEPFRRIAGGRIDIGAFEAQSLVVDTLVDESDGDFSAGDFSLREAVKLANQFPGMNKIEFADSLAGGTIYLIQGELAISDAVEIVGLGADLLTIDASSSDLTPDLKIGDGSRVFNIITQSQVSFAGMTITGGDAAGNGGGILGSNFSLQGVNIVNNAANGAGGGISGDFLSVVDSIVTGNLSTGGRGGGGISAYGQLYVSHTTISNNETNLRFGSGGGIWAQWNVTIEHSTIDNNKAASGSGGIRVEQQGTVSIRHSTISNNVGTTYGGGIGVRDGLLNIENSHIFGNSNAIGGGIWTLGGALNILNSVITGNTAGEGGGIYAGRTLTVSRSTISGNLASAEAARGVIGIGGGIYAREGANIRESTIADNSAVAGGGIFSPAIRGSLTITNSTIQNNFAESNGGGVSASKGQIIQSTISNNTAAMGAGLYLGSITQRFYLSQNTITLNNARGIGGGVFSNGTPIEISNTVIAGNLGNNPDLAGVLGVNLYVFYSIIGTNKGNNLQRTFGTPDANGNLIGGASSNEVVNPQLGPLANNGGPTHTHALLSNSPAIDAGSSSHIVAGISLPEFDQRGAPFARIANGRIDIGAYESQPAAGLLNGDFDGDGDVDGRDFLIWQRGAGTTPADKADGDATGNNVVDSQDLAVWQATYGQSGLNTLPLALIVDHEVTDSVPFLAVDVPSEVSMTLSDETAPLGFQVGAITDEEPTEGFDYSAIANEPLVDETTWDTAFDNWLPQRAAFAFGDIATRRAVRRSGLVISR